MKKKIMVINIIGTNYTIYTDVPKDDEKLNNMDGYCMPEKKKIILDANSVPEHKQHVLAHELTHAFLYESGLDVETWARNEEIVDWIAIQLFKISSTVKKAQKKLKEANENGRKEN